MSSIFQQATGDISKIEGQVLGPTYNYWKQINSPAQMGMSDKGDLQTLGKDVNGLVNYVELLVTGQGGASKTGGPLGNRFFLKTGGKCNAGGVDASGNPNLYDSNGNKTTSYDGNPKLTERFIYIDHIPNGNIPFISSGMGQNFGNFRGLIPGTISNLNTFNPAGLFGAFMSGTNPPCQQVTLSVTDHLYGDQSGSSETRYITTSDYQTYQSLQNKQGFTTMENSDNNQLPSDPIVQGYFVCLSILALYILFNLYKKK